MDMGRLAARVHAARGAWHSPFLSEPRVEVRAKSRLLAPRGFVILGPL